MSEGRITLRQDCFKLDIVGEHGGRPTISHQYADGAEIIQIELRANSDIAYYVNHKQVDRVGHSQRIEIIFGEIKRQANFYSGFAFGPIAPRLDPRFDLL